MKKSIILCIMVLFMTSAILTAQVPEWQWAEQAGGVSTDYGSGISVDANGNSYGTGRFKGTATFGADTLTSSGDYDVFVAKIDADGNCQWAKQAGGPFTCYGSGISVDANGNSYVTGSFSGTATFGAFTLTSSGSGDVFVAKIDTDGNCQWAINAGGSSGDYGSGISVDANGNSYVTGRFEGIATFGADTLTSSGLRDVFVAKLDADGNWQWAKQAGGSSYDYGYGISVDANGNSYVTGNFELTAIFGAFTLTSSGSNDIFVAKLDTDGNWQWAKQAGGSVGDTGSGISVDANGNSYGTGRFAGTATFGADTLTSSGDNDIFVAKIDTDGNWQWAKQAGGSSGDNGNGISVDANGNSYVNGYFAGTAIFGAFTLTSNGASDVFVAKLDTDGNWQWAKQAGGSGDDRANGISVDANGNSYVNGYFAGTAIFGAFTLTSSGSYDVFVAKLPDYLLIGDFNSDGYVDAADLLLLGDHWHFVDTDPGWDALYDLVVDGIIDAADLQVFGDHWHEGTPPKYGEGGKDGKGPNENAGIVFDLNATTYGNQNLTGIPSQPAGTYIRVDVYCTGVQNLDTYEFEVIYDPTELAYVAASATNPITFEPNILTTNGGTALGWMIDSSTPGVLSLAYTLAGTDTLEAPEGEGLIADIVFLSLVATHGTLSFGDVYYYDSYGVVDLITDTGTATLPFELSAFTATFNETNGYTTIEWTTASENDVIGFNIYRSDCDEFSTAKKINSEIVEGHGSTTEIHEYEFVDIDQLHYGTTYYYWLESVELSGINSVCESISLTPEEGTGGFIDDFEANILTNYPNPFKGSTTIEYGIKGMLRAETVEIRIYNILGQLVDTVEGKYGTATWNSTNHSTGIYFYKLATEHYSEIQKMMIQ